MKRRLSVTNLSSENNLPMFRLNPPIVIRAKVKKSNQTLLFIAMHYQGQQTEIGDETEGTLRCLREGDDGEVSCSGACMGKSPPDPLGGDPVLTMAEDRSCW